MTSSPSGVAGVFDRSADTYDAVGVPWFGPIAQRLVAELDPRPGERALDLGCGRGAALKPLAAAVGTDGSVLGLDLAPRMVTNTAADVRDLPHVEVRVGDAAAPGLPPSSYDVVTASLVLFFLPDPAAALRTWHALLAPGGRLGVSTFGQQDERWKAVDALFTPYLPKQMLDARTSGRTGPFGSDEGVEALLTGAGVVDVRTVGWRLDAEFDDAQQWLAWSWSHGQRAMWEAVPDDQREPLEQEAFALLESFRGDDGRLRFGQDIRLTLGRRS